MEAGNRCFDQVVPEEINRRFIDHLSDVNMPYSERARDNLVREGIPADRIVTTGSPLKEVLTHYRKNIADSDVLVKLDLKPKNYFVFSAHREEHVDHPPSLEKLAQVLRELAARHGQRIVFSCHPRTRARLGEVGALPQLVEVVKPLGFFDFVKLQSHATAVISDSGTVTEESAILNFPAISLRRNFERAEGMDAASIILGSLDPATIMNALAVLETQASSKSRVIAIPRDYDVDNVSEKVVRTLLSFTPYIKHKVWGTQ
jgi:UDP-N-acetylglucosamine 2-epimerase (non-hydrolysing)